MSTRKDAQKFPMQARMWSIKNSHSFLAEIQNDTATLEFSLATVAKHILSLRFKKCSLRYLVEGVENVYPLKRVFVNVYSSFIHNFP